MQPLRMTIPGKYWDSFIYKGRLYLFGLDGDIRSIDWRAFMSSWKVPRNTEIPFVCAFQRSDFLYSSDVHELMMDPDIRQVMSSKFDRLSTVSLQATEKMLKAAEKGRQETPFPFPHADLELYNDQLFVGSADGLFKTTCNKKTRYPVSVRPEKRWDGPALGLSASYGSLAVAGGGEGLFELAVNSWSYGERNEPKQLSPGSCRDCGWAYFSVFASSDKSGYLAEFAKVDKDGKYDRSATRHFEGIEGTSKIFGSEGYSWGIQDKLCQAIRGGIKVVKYSPWTAEPELRIQALGTVRFDGAQGEVVSAATANFGVVVELESCLYVFPSEGPPIKLPGEPVNWRVFPRSRHYENQLHAIYDDRLEIFSFNHDYLVSQEDKVLGLSVFSRTKNRNTSSVSDLVLH